MYMYTTYKMAFVALAHAHTNMQTMDFATARYSVTIIVTSTRLMLKGCAHVCIDTYIKENNKMVVFHARYTQSTKQNRFV